MPVVAVLVAAVLAVAGCAAPRALPAPSPLLLGIVGDARGWGPRYLDEYRLLGVAAAREEWDSGDVDGEILGEAAARGLTVLPLLNPTDGQNNRDWDGTRDWMAEFARVNGPGGTFWRTHGHGEHAPTHVEIVNEPYVARSAGGDPDPATYARFLAHVVPAIRAANPRLKVLLSADTAPEGHDDVDWIGRMYEAVPQLNDLFDAVAVHPYGGDPDDGCRPDERWSFCRTERMRERFVAHGAAGKPFWITEIGNPTGGGSAAHATALSEEDQARYLQGYLERAERYGFVEALFTYHFRDFDCTDGIECYFGVTRPDGSHKPSWDVLHAAAGPRR